MVPSDTSTARFTELFHEYDVDSSGEMDLDEFRKLVGILTAQQDAARAKAAAALEGGGGIVTDADERWELERSAALVLRVVANAAVSAAHHAAAAAAAAYVRSCAPGDAEARRAARRQKGRAMRERAARRQEECQSGSALLGLTVDTDATGSPESRTPISPRVIKGRALREARFRRHTFGGDDAQRGAASSAVEMTTRQRRRSLSRSESASSVLEQPRPRRRSLSRAGSASNLRAKQ